MLISRIGKREIPFPKMSIFSSSKNTISRTENLECNFGKWLFLEKKILVSPNGNSQIRSLSEKMCISRMGKTLNVVPRNQHYIFSFEINLFANWKIRNVISRNKHFFFAQWENLGLERSLRSKWKHVEFEKKNIDVLLKKKKKSMHQKFTTSS